MNQIKGEKQKNELVSIIVRVYNRTRYLPLALKSVTNQSYPFLECIVVDDSTNEESSVKIKRIISRFPDIKIFYHKTPFNLGYIGAIFEGVKHAKGEYILLLDDDDILTPQCIKSNLKELSTAPPKTIIVSGKPLFINYTNAPIIGKLRKFPTGIFHASNFLPFPSLIKSSPVWGLSGYLILKNSFILVEEKYRKNDEEKNEPIFSPDIFILLKLLTEKNSFIKYHKSITSFYREHKNSYTAVLTKKSRYLFSGFERNHSHISLLRLFLFLLTFTSGQIKNLLIHSYNTYLLVFTFKNIFSITCSIFRSKKGV